MKTPMQELIEKINQWMLDDNEVLNNPLDYEEYMVIYASQMINVKMKFIDMCESLLEKEKKQIMDAWIDGGGCSYLPMKIDKILAEEYYNETYKDTEQ